MGYFIFLSKSRRLPTKYIIVFVDKTGNILHAYCSTLPVSFVELFLIPGLLRDIGRIRSQVYLSSSLKIFNGTTDERAFRAQVAPSHVTRCSICNNLIRTKRAVICTTEVDAVGCNAYGENTRPGSKTKLSHLRLSHTCHIKR